MVNITPADVPPDPAVNVIVPAKSVPEIDADAPLPAEPFAAIAGAAPDVLSSTLSNHAA
jgi:hypothetical protein